MGLFPGKKDKMTKQQYDYHYCNAGSDPPLSTNIIRIIRLSWRWINSRATPREEKELIDDLIFIKQRKNKNGKN